MGVLEDGYQGDFSFLVAYELLCVAVLGDRPTKKSMIR